jgi:hypothetical protein
MRAMTKRSLRFLALSCALLSTPAFAQDAPQDPSGGAAQPRPLALADLSPTRRFGAEIGWGTFGDGQVDAYLLELVADTVIGDNIKVFGRIPLVRATYDIAFFGDDTGSALGNLQAGARFIRDSGDGTIVGVTAQASLPTAPSPDLTDAGSRAALAGASLRFTEDPSRYLGDTFTLRGGADVRVSAGNVFAQGGAAVDLFFYTGDEDLEDERVTYMYLFAGAGVLISPRLAFLVELTTWADLFEESQAEQDYRHAAHLGVRHEGNVASVGGHLTYFLDDDSRDEEMRAFFLDVMVRLP